MPKSRDFLSNDSKGNKVSGIGLEEIDIPFLDAHQELGEVPIDDLDAFIVPARDEKGVSQPLHLSVPPIILRHIDVLIRSNRFPYLRPADLIRHGIVRHIRWLTSIRTSIPRHMLVSLEAIMEDCRDSEQRARVEEVLQRIEERVKFNLDRGEVGEVLRLLSVMRARIDSNFQDYWGREVKLTLEKKFFEPLLQAGAILETKH